MGPCGRNWIQVLPNGSSSWIPFRSILGLGNVGYCIELPDLERQPKASHQEIFLNSFIYFSPLYDDFRNTLLVWIGLTYCMFKLVLHTGHWNFESASMLAAKQ